MVNLRTLQSVAVRGKAALCVGVERFVLARSMGVIACTHDIPPATKEGRLPGGDATDSHCLFYRFLLWSSRVLRIDVRIQCGATNPETLGDFGLRDTVGNPCFSLIHLLLR